MSTPDATPQNAATGSGFIVAGPRKSDSIGGALRSAFGHHQDSAADEFAALLRRIDLADREAGTC